MKTTSFRWNRIVILILIPIVLCAALLAFGPRIGRVIRQSMWKHDPIQAALLAHAMTDYALPAGYLEKAYFQIQDTSQVLIAHEGSTEGMDILLSNETLDMSQQELVEALEDNWSREIGGHTYQTRRTRTETITLHEQETRLSYRTGTDENGQSVQQVVTIFYGKVGWTVVVIVSPVERWDQNLVDEFLHSLN